jgi:hypothetical protein
MSVRRNLDRTLLKVRWQAGGECVVFPEELEEIPQAGSDVDDVFRCVRIETREADSRSLCYAAASWSRRAWVISPWRGIPISV